MSLASLKSRDDFGSWLTAHGLVGDGAEIGVFEGSNAFQLLLKWPGVLHLIDPYEKLPDYAEGEGWDFKAIFAKARAKLLPFGDRAVWHRMSSDEAFMQIRARLDLSVRTAGAPMFDFVYLDGDHSGLQVSRDIENWWTLVKPGGVLGMHDFFETIVAGVGEHCKEIAPIVKTFAAKHGLDIHLTTEDFPISCFLQKPPIQ